MSIVSGKTEWVPMIEKQVLQHLEALRNRQPLPLRVTLWNGATVALGDEPRVDLRLKDAASARYFLKPSMSALGEAFVEGHIDVDGDIRDVVSVAERLSRSSGEEPGRGRLPSWLARHTRKSDRQAIEYHYDVSNEFYAAWLDPRMVYSCAYFRSGADDLDTAQRQKLDHICRKLRLRPGELLLDIGAGWGGLIRWAAKRYGVKAVGVTLSEEQYLYARERIAADGLNGRVEIHLQDYRDVPGAVRFDKIVSVGMYEHVGLANLPVYFKTIARLLKPGGALLNHGIIITDPEGRAQGPPGGEFINRHVFPGGELANLSRVITEFARAGLEPTDVEDLRPHYALTLSHWSKRLEARAAEAMAAAGLERYRIWRLYLPAMAYAFQRGWLSVAQVLGYKPLEAGMAPRPWTREHQYSGSGESDDGVERERPRSDHGAARGTIG